MLKLLRNGKTFCGDKVGDEIVLRCNRVAVGRKREGNGWEWVMNNETRADPVDSSTGRLKNAGLEYAAPKCRGAICDRGKCGSRSQAWKMQERAVWQANVKVNQATEHKIQIFFFRCQCDGTCNNALNK